MSSPSISTMIRAKRIRNVITSVIAAVLDIAITGYLILMAVMGEMSELPFMEWKKILVV